MNDEYLYANLSIWMPEPHECEGKYDIPRIRGTGMPTLDSWMPINYALSSNVNGCIGLSTFVHDYQIQRLWNQPQRYAPIAAKAGCVIAPDYSMYTNTPTILNIYNHYRKHWVAAYWQRQGARVIPAINWAGKDTFDWCFDGEPTNGTVAVSSVGTQRYADTQKAFMLGYDAMLERLQPETILFFGKVTDGFRGNICPVETFYKQVERRRKDGR